MVKSSLCQQKKKKKKGYMHVGMAANRANNVILSYYTTGR